jgi:hypothetical protein
MSTVFVAKDRQPLPGISAWLTRWNPRRDGAFKKVQRGREVRLLGPHLLKGNTGGIIVGRGSESCQEGSPGIITTPNCPEGGSEVGQIFRVMWRDLHGNLELRDGIGKAALLAVNRAEITVQRRVEIVGLRMDI